MLLVLLLLVWVVDDVVLFVVMVQVDGVLVAQDGSVKCFDSVVVMCKCSQISVVVVGKQVEECVMDSVICEQVECLLDFMVIDVVKCVVGVLVSFNLDNVNGWDKVQFIVICGFDGSYNNVIINGVLLVLVDQIICSVCINMLLVLMVKEVQVFKIWIFDMDFNVVGGLVNIVSCSVFDNGGKFMFSVIGVFGYVGGSGKVVLGVEGLVKKLDVIFSNIFGLDNCFGYVILVNFEKENMVLIGYMIIDNIFYNYYNVNGSIVNLVVFGGFNIGNGFLVLQQFKYWQYFKNSEISGFNVKLEGCFILDVYGFLGFGYNSDFIYILCNEIFIDDSCSIGNNLVLNQIVISGQFVCGEVEVGYVVFIIKCIILVLQGGLDWKLDDSQVFLLCFFYL